jgi:hypothetical protein
MGAFFDRVKEHEYSHLADFSIKGVIGFNYSDATPLPIHVSYSLDGVEIGPESDLNSVVDTIAEFLVEKSNGTADPTSKALVTNAGQEIVYNPTADTLQFVPRGAVAFDLIASLHDLLKNKLGYPGTAAYPNPAPVYPAPVGP